MAILSRIKILPQARLDLEDITGLLSDFRTDSKLYSQHFISANNKILSGFSLSGIGLNSATLIMAGSALILSENTSDFSYFVAQPAATNITIPDADLTDNTRNYLEIQLCTVDGTPLTKVFWDSETNAGSGAEFTQIVNTVTDLQVKVVSLAGGFSGSPDSIPLAILDISNSGQIETILDRRPLFGRLATPTDLSNEYPWGTKIEPPYSLVMSGVVGTFVLGEVITIGGETATVTTGGTTTISFREPTGINFFPGGVVSGGTSGATGTIATVAESFVGVDKSLNTQQVINEALMTELKRIKGTSQWYADSPVNLTSALAFINSVLVQDSLGAHFKWDGSELSINDQTVTPLNLDGISLLRQMGLSSTISLTRQSVGQEIQLISFDAVPDSGTLTLDHNGDVSNVINPGDDASAVQTALNATWTATVTVTGDFAKGFSILFDAPGSDVGAATVGTNSFTASSTAVVVTPTTIQNGYAGGSAIPIGVGQVLFLKIPSTGNRTFDGVGSADTNYQVVNRSAFVANDEHYWLAYREGGLLYIRGIGELQSGEEANISDPDKETLLALIEAQSTRSNVDRNLELTNGGTWSVATSGAALVLTISANAQVSMAGLQLDRNRILAQSLTFPNVNSTAFVQLNRSVGVDSTRVVSVVDIVNVPSGDDIYVLARRTLDGILVG